MAINVVQLKLSDHFRQASNKIIGQQLAEAASQSSVPQSPTELQSVTSSNSPDNNGTPRPSSEISTDDKNTVNTNSKMLWKHETKWISLLSDKKEIFCDVLFLLLTSTAQYKILTIRERETSINKGRRVVLCRDWRALVLLRALSKFSYYLRSIFKYLAITQNFLYFRIESFQWNLFARFRRVVCLRGIK